MRRRCVTVQRRGKYSRRRSPLRQLNSGRQPADPHALAFAFVTPDYVPHIEEFSEIVRVDGHVIELVGATGAGFTVGGEENEEGGGFVLLALGSHDGVFEVRTFDQAQVEESTEPAFWRKLCGVKSPGAWIALSNPFSFDTERWLAEWNVGVARRAVCRRTWRPDRMTEKVSESFTTAGFSMPCLFR